MPIRVYYEVLNQKGSPAVYADNYAQRPAAGYTGRIFYSPDTAQIFYDTGTTWTLLADAGVGSGSLASVCANGNTTATGIVITAGGLSTNSITNSSNTAGSVLFAGASGVESQSNATFFWDNTNKRLGLGNNAPGVTLDVHGTGTLVQLNGTGANNSFLQFQNAGVSKWRIGNLYNAGNNDFQLYNNNLGAAALTISTSSSAATFVGSVTTAGLIANSLQIIQGTTIITSGRTGIGALVNGLTIGLDSGFTQQLYFPTAAAYIYTYPSSTGTLINATSFTSNTLPKYSSTAGVLTASMLSDDGTNLTSLGATRSNLLLRAANNTYYGQLAFTNGSNGSYGGLSYNNSGQYMQFETNSSEWLRLLSTGELGINTTSPDYPLTIKTNASANSLKILGRTSGDTSISWNDSTNTTQYAHIDVGSTYFQIYASNSQPIQFYSGGSERMRISSTGTVQINNTANYSAYKLVVTSAGTTNATAAFRCEDSATYGLFEVLSDGIIKFGTRTNSPYNYTTGSGANAFLYATGEIGRSTSSLKYKTDVLDYDKGLDLIKQLRPVYYKGKNDGTKQFAGFIAEEVNELGLTEFVQYAEDGSPDALNYANMTALLTKGIQQIDDRLTALEQKIN